MTSRRVAYSPSALIVLVGIYGVVVTGCGDSKDEAEPPAAESKSQTIDDTTTAHTLALPSGSAVEVPPGSLPAGSSVTLATTTAPSDFGAATSGDNTPASDPVEVKMEDKNGQPFTATTPLTLAIPYQSGTALESVEKVVANLVALAKDYLGNLAYWRRGSYGIDETTKIVKLAISVGGMYQLAYIKEGAIPGFQSAQAKKPTANVNLGTITCDSGKSSLYAKAKDNAAFTAYYDAVYECYCKAVVAVGGSCDDTIKAMFTSSMCISSQAYDALTSQQITEVYTTAKSAVYPNNACATKFMFRY